MPSTWYIGEDMTEDADAINVSGTYLNSATITYAITDAAGTAVSGGTGSYSYTAASNGDYTAVIESTVTTLLTEGGLYYLTVTGSQGNYNWRRRLPRWAAYRGED